LDLLLETHALLWWLAGDTSLSAAASDAIGDGSNDVFVSAASAWEIASRFRIGKLPGATLIIAELADVVATQGFVTRSVSRTGGWPRRAAWAASGPVRPDAGGAGDGGRYGAGVERATVRRVWRPAALVTK
jgi:hypothetical protein